MKIFHWRKKKAPPENWFDKHLEEIRDTKEYVAAGYVLEITNQLYPRVEKLDVKRRKAAEKIFDKYGKTTVVDIAELCNLAGVDFVIRFEEKADPA